MKACVVAGPGQSIIKDVPVPEINDDEVLIKVKTCGVCASELFIWANGIGAGEKILGHEPVGIIEAMGKNVKGFAVGDRITGMIWEAFAEYAKADYRNIAKVPEQLSDEEAIGEPLSCLMSGAERTLVHIGDTVAIIGLGFMGLGFMQLMKLKGAGKIIGIDVREEGLKHALHFGADEVLFPSQVPDTYKVVDWDHMDGGVDVVAEASGSQSGLELAGNMARLHGTVSVLGFHQNGMRTVNMELWNWKAITIINAHERRNDMHVRYMKAGLPMIAKGLFNMKDMITHEFALDDIDAAFQTLRDKPNGYIKAVVKMH